MTRARTTFIFSKANIQSPMQFNLSNEDLNGSAEAYSLKVANTDKFYVSILPVTVQALPIALQSAKTPSLAVIGCK
jgi:hypothetical protein